jgi:hypothetical protein
MGLLKDQNLKNVLRIDNDMSDKFLQNVEDFVVDSMNSCLHFN